MASIGEFPLQNGLGDANLDRFQRLTAEVLNALEANGQLTRTALGNWEIVPGGAAVLSGLALGEPAPPRSNLLLDLDSYLASAILLAPEYDWVRHVPAKPLFGQLRILSAYDAGIPLLVEGFSTGQTGKLIQCRRSPGGSVRFEVDPTGFMMVDDGFGGAVIKDISGNTIFRGIFASAWIDATNSTYFQIGAAGGKVVLTTATSLAAERFLLDAAWLQISSRGATSVPAPAGTRGVEFYRYSSDTNSAGLALVQDNESSGTPAAGFGTRWEWRSHSSTTTRTPQAAREVTWATATHASRKARVVDYVYDTAQREALRHEADGANALSAVGGAVAADARLVVYSPDVAVYALRLLAGAGFGVGVVQDWCNSAGASVANMTAQGRLTASRFIGDGGSLTDLDASAVTTGTLGDAFLSANVPLKDAANTFTQPITVASLAALGADVFSYSTAAANDDPTYRAVQNRVATTDATATTLETITIAASKTYLIEARVLARRTGGAAGTADDGATYIRRAMVTTKGGTVTINAVQDGLTQEDQAGWDCTIDVSGAAVRVRVTGAADNSVTWHSTVVVQEVGT